MRRTEREKGREFAKAVIDGCGYMVLAMTGADGSPYCVPLSPVRWDEAVYFHCALDGRKLDALRANPRVCMTFVAEDYTYPAGEFTACYASAIASGTAREVTDGKEKTEALRRLTLKYCPADIGSFGQELQKYYAFTGVWKVSLEELAGKENPKKEIKKRA